MKKNLKRNDNSENAREIWKAVDSAASRAPDAVKRHFGSLVDTNKADDQRSNRRTVSESSREG